MGTGIHYQDSSSREFLKKKNLVATGTGMPGNKELRHRIKDPGIGIKQTSLFWNQGKTQDGTKMKVQIFNKFDLPQVAEKLVSELGEMYR